MDTTKEDLKDFVTVTQEDALLPASSSSSNTGDSSLMSKLEQWTHQAGEATANAWKESSSKLQSCWATSSEHTRRTSQQFGQQFSESTKGLAESYQKHAQPHLNKAGDSMRALGDQTRSLGESTVTRSRDLGISTQAATFSAVMAAKQSIQQIGSIPLASDPETGETIVKGEETDKLITGVHPSLIQIIAAGGFVSAIVSFFMVVGHLVDVASLLLILISPLVAYQKHVLRGLGGMRGQQNRLRRSVNEFTKQNAMLSNSVTELTGHVGKLQKVEDDLNEIAAKSGTQVDRLVTIVQENGELQKKIKDALQSQVMQQVMTAILAVDRNRDFTLSPNEVQILEMRLQNIPGVIFDLEKFHHFLKSDVGELTLADVCGIAHNVTDDTVPDEEKLFHFRPHDILEQ